MEDLDTVLKESDIITKARRFYANETEFSAHFEQYLKSNPQKQLFLQHIQMENTTVYKDEQQEWITRAAQYQNDSRLNISNSF